MEFIELSLESSKEEIRKLAEKVKNNYDYDLVIFIAKGSYTIGKEFALYNNVPLLQIFATRKGNKLKKILSPIFKVLPSKLCKVLRNIELKSNIHDKKIERKVSFNEKIWRKYKERQKILLVDDSVDSGNSIILTKKAISDFFKSSEIRVAALNKFKKSENNVCIEYFAFEDIILKGPWSNDSKEHNVFLDLYNDYVEE